MKTIIRSLLEHNPRHYTRICVHNEEYKICSRCLGMWTIGIISFIICGILYMQGLRLSLYTTLLSSIVLAFICFFDWVSAKTILWNGNNKIRNITGALLGISISIYLWFLPVNLWIRLISLSMICLTFSVIVFIVNYHELKQGLINIYDTYFFKHNKIFGCCCGTSCGCLPMVCCYIGLILCCCICPVIIICFLLKK